MAISFLRIDDRLIHGQIVACWMGSNPCDGIVVVDNDAANNSIQRKVLMSILPNVKTWIFDLETAIEKIPKVIASEKKYYLIARSPKTLRNLVDEGIDILKAKREINVGPLEKVEGAIQVNKGQGVTKEAAKHFKILAATGFSIEFRLLPDNKSVHWQDVEKRFEGGVL